MKTSAGFVLRFYPPHLLSGFIFHPCHSALFLTSWIWNTSHFIFLLLPALQIVLVGPFSGNLHDSCLHLFFFINYLSALLHLSLLCLLFFLSSVLCSLLLLLIFMSPLLFSLTLLFIPSLCWALPSFPRCFSLLLFAWLCLLVNKQITCSHSIQDFLWCGKHTR